MSLFGDLFKNRRSALKEEKNELNEKIKKERISLNAIEKKLKVSMKPLQECKKDEPLKINCIKSPDIIFKNIAKQILK